MWAVGPTAWHTVHSRAHWLNSNRTHTQMRHKITGYWCRSLFEKIFISFSVGICFVCVIPFDTPEHTRSLLTTKPVLDVRIYIGIAANLLMKCCDWTLGDEGESRRQSVPVRACAHCKCNKIKFYVNVWRTVLCAAPPNAKLHSVLLIKKNYWRWNAQR